MFELWWISEDKQGEIPMGEFASEEAATAAVADAKEELLSQCGTEEGVDSINSGSWVICEFDDNR